MPRSGPADAPLDGSAVFAAKLGDTVISAAGVSAARPALGFSLFTDQLGSAATGLALANPGAGTATVTLTLRDKNGGPVASATRPLAPYEHTALFTHELFSQVEGIDAFEGVIDVANTSEVAAVTLRFDHQDLVFTTEVPGLTFPRLDLSAFENPPAMIDNLSFC